MSATSCAEYTELAVYAPFCASSGNPGSSSGKLWLSTMCQWNWLICYANPLRIPVRHRQGVCVP